MIKVIHVTTVFISIGFFIVRFYWMVAGSTLLTTKPVKILPHVNDTILLLSAIVLAISTAQYPFSDQWLTVKVIGLLIYIVLGSIALKRGRTKSKRIVAGFSAIILFAFIVSVAVTRSPLGFF